MKAEIIAVGSELLTSTRLDTNSLFLTQELNRLGIEVVRKLVIGDLSNQIRDAFHEALGRVELVISIGGLGPTEDDLTRETVAALLGRKLVLNEAILRHIQGRFRRFGRQMPEVNKRQAMVPEGAVILENPKGTAPGLWLESNRHIVILLPGPPHELKAMFTEQVALRLERRSSGVRLLSRELRVAGMPESDVDQRIAPIYKHYPEAQATILAALGEIQIHLRVWSADTPAAEMMLNEIVERVSMALGENLFTTAGESLEEVVARLLNLNGATIAAAESCTGGLLAQRLTSIPGSSSYFLGGVVCYSNDLKSAWVDVPAEIIEEKGAVSPEVARALAEGIRRRSGSTLGLGITGIAGPGGGTPEKPVGTVHIAVAHEAGTRERGLHYPGDRERIRWQASQTALDMVRRHFLYAQQAKGCRLRGAGRFQFSIAGAEGRNLRVFVALDIPEDVRRAIGNLISKLEKSCRGARWVRVEGMHVTLKFIGEVSSEKEERIKEALAGVRSAEPVEMHFSGGGFFPNERHPRVFWTGIEASPNLTELASEIETRMERLGIAREQRPFRPHLTLARFKSEEGLERLREALRDAGLLEFGSVRTGEVHLYQSQLNPRGAVYTRLATYSFVAAAGGAS